MILTAKQIILFQLLIPVTVCAADTSVKTIRGAAHVASLQLPMKKSIDAYDLAGLVHLATGRQEHLVHEVERDRRGSFELVSAHTGLFVPEDDMMIPVIVRDEAITLSPIKPSKNPHKVLLYYYELSRNWAQSGSVQFSYEGKSYKRDWLPQRMFPLYLPYSWFAHKKNGDIISFMAWGCCLIRLRCEG